MDDPESLMRAANDLLRRALTDGMLPGLLALLTAAARLAERNGVSRDSVHTLLDVAYRVSADVGDDDSAPTFKARVGCTARRGRTAKVTV